jgi:hypothetical protein
MPQWCVFSNALRDLRRIGLSATAAAVGAATLAAAVDISIGSEPMGRAAGHGCGHARWGVKTLSDDRRTAVNFRAKTTTIATLHKKDRPPFKIGKDTPRLGPPFVETQTYRLRNVNLVEVKRVTDDGDYHLVIADDAGRQMIVELADPECVEKAFKRRRIATARRQYSAACGVPTTSFKPLTGTATITGVALLDIKHTIRGAAPNFIELHPVLSFTNATC